jgi:uncharacterized protein involved in exopolysaccharide biosynthesis
MGSKKNDFNLNSTDIIRLVWDRRRFLVLVVGLAFAISLVGSLFITPLFKSSAIIYPPKAGQQSKDVFTASTQSGLTVFGEDDESEQLLQVLSSNALAEITISRLNLMEHWRIDPIDRYARHNALGMFNERVKCSLTKYQSVEVVVMDPNPDMAANIANTITDVADSLTRSIKAQVALKALHALEEQHNGALNDLNAAEDSLAAVMAKGVIQIDEQTEQYFKAYAKAVATGNQAAIANLEKKIDILKRYGSKYIRLSADIQNLAEQVANLKQSIKVLKVEASQSIPSQFIVDKAIPAQKKAYPKKSIIVIVSTLSTFFFAVVLLLATDFVRNTLSRVRKDES